MIMLMTCISILILTLAILSTLPTTILIMITTIRQKNANSEWFNCVVVLGTRVPPVGCDLRHVMNNITSDFIIFCSILLCSIIFDYISL